LGVLGRSDARVCVLAWLAAVGCARPAPAPAPPSAAPTAAPGRPRPPIGGVVGRLERDENGAVRVGGNIREPRKTKSVDPVYPAAAKEARIQGAVVLEAVISVEGRVEDLNVLRSVPELEEAAIEAVRQWEYTPTLLAGVPVPVIMTVTVNLRLQ
jgi:TonB family protein